jgi:UDP-glucose 4-epimerase
MASLDLFEKKTLLITGGTGSFGNAVAEKFLDTNIKEIRILSRDEKKQDDMRKKYKNEKLKFYIGDVRDYSSVNNAMIGVDYIFHSAALKQVPSCEFHPMEAVKTNIIGTDNVLEAAIQNKVKKVVCLSTDGKSYCCKIKKQRLHSYLWNSLWKCNGFERFSYSIVYKSNNY